LKASRFVPIDSIFYGLMARYRQGLACSYDRLIAQADLPSISNEPLIGQFVPDVFPKEEIHIRLLHVSRSRRVTIRNTQH